MSVAKKPRRVTPVRVDVKTQSPSDKLLIKPHDGKDAVGFVSGESLFQYEWTWDRPAVQPEYHLFVSAMFEIFKVSDMCQAIGASNGCMLMAEKEITSLEFRGDIDLTTSRIVRLLSGILSSQQKTYVFNTICYAPKTPMPAPTFKTDGEIAVSEYNGELTRGAIRVFLTRFVGTYVDSERCLIRVDWNHSGERERVSFNAREGCPLLKHSIEVVSVWVALGSEYVGRLRVSMRLGNWVNSG